MSPADVVVLVCALVVFILVVYGWVQTYWPDPDKGLTYTCDCGKTVKPKKVHKVIDTGERSSEIASIGGIGAGTAMAAYFCPEHCPGNCNKEHHAA